MLTGTQFQSHIDIDDDEQVWEYIMAFWNEEEEYNRRNGTKIRMFTTADDRLLVFDDPVRLMDDDACNISICRVIEIGGQKAYDPVNLRGYLDFMGVKQEIEPQLLLMST